VGGKWNVTVIPNGVDAAEFQSNRKRDPRFKESLGLRTNKTTILLVNRDFQDMSKGFEVAREAIARNSKAPMQIVLVGMNAEWAASRLEAIDTLAVGYVSSRKLMADFLEAADILLFPSPEENFPCTVLEAMASECCVVATPTEGAKEQIEHGRS